MPLADIYAIGIATGYAACAVGIWYVRRAYVGVESFGYLLYPALGAWVVFYASLPFADEAVHRHVYVWVSRGAHTLSIMLMILVIKLGTNILSTIKDANRGEH